MSSVPDSTDAWRWLSMAISMVERAMVSACWARPRVNRPLQQLRTSCVCTSDLQIYTHAHITSWTGPGLDWFQNVLKMVLYNWLFKLVISYPLVKNNNIYTIHQ